MISKNRKERLLSFLKKQNLEIHDLAMLDSALLHSEKRFSRKKQRQHQQLEFLGDAVLGLVIADLLLEAYPEMNEGVLAKWKGYLVSGEFLVKIAKEMDLDSIIQTVLRDAQKREGRGYLEDSLEALFGAVFLSQGYQYSRDYIESLYKPHLQKKHFQTENTLQYAKSMLQELFQRNYKAIPEYRILKQEGPSHKPYFSVGIYVDSQEISRGEGSSKKVAEQKAALEAMEAYFPEVAKIESSKSEEIDS